MNTLLSFALGNVAVAFVLAAIAWVVGRTLRRPALTHGLWLLVFLKLLTPPLISIPIIRTAAPSVAAGPPPIVAPATEAAPAVDLSPKGDPNLAPEWNVPGEAPPRDDRLAPPEDGFAQGPAPLLPRVPAQIALAPAVPAPAPIAAETWDWSWLPVSAGWVWLTGAAAWFLLAAARMLRFQRWLRFGRRASPELYALAKSVARKMELRAPRLVLVPGLVSPMLWAFGKTPRLVLPESLVGRLTPEQWRTLLAHELAHWRRGDHWVRWLELITLSLYWWCPLVWWAKRELQEAEEECCDAWVVTTLPDAARAYALALVETIDFLSGARTVLPPAASGLGHIHLLRRRVTMILSGRTPRALTLTGFVAVVSLGLMLLPLAPSWAQDAPLAQGDKDKKEDKADKKDDKGDKDSPAAARQELLRLQDSMVKLQTEMAQKRREFEEKMNKEFGEKQRELMTAMQEAMRKAGVGGFPGAFPGGGPGGFPGNVAPLAPGQQPNFAQNLFPQPGGFGGGGFGAVPRPDVERRLDELERKIDRLMDRLGGGQKGDRPRQPREGKDPPPNLDRGGAGAQPPAVRPPQAQNGFGAVPPPLSREQ
jgi:beta-lactamase regulating signal transducer with metallopeptidase domain